MWRERSGAVKRFWWIFVFVKRIFAICVLQ